MFGEAAMRLRREFWQTRDRPGKPGVHKTQQLAEEISLILENTNPLTHNAPLTLKNPNPNSTESPLELFPPLNIPGITINYPNGATTKVGPDGITNTDANGNTSSPGGGGGDFARITGGSGTTYTAVNLRTNAVITITNAAINADETVPVGTVVPVDSGNRFFIGLWL